MEQIRGQLSIFSFLMVLLMVPSSSFDISRKSADMYSSSNNFLKVNRRKCARPSRGTLRHIQMQAASNGLRLLELAEHKKHEVRQLLHEHHRGDDPLQMRLTYYNDDSQILVKEALRRAKGMEDNHQLSVICDIKRQSPTGMTGPRQLANFVTSGDVATQMVSYGADAVMINTDFQGWAGDMSDLETTAQMVNNYRSPLGGTQQGSVATLQEAAAGRSLSNMLQTEQMLDPELAPSPSSPNKQKKVPIIMKDLIIHPIQIALALETGANCVHLCAALVGSGLEDLLDATTIMGTEALVEVHTPGELEYALELGASLIMVNNWDRIEGTLHREQAFALSRSIPPHVVTVAAGGIFSSEQAFALADQGYDAVVLGRAMSESEDIKKLITKIRGRKGLQRQFLGWGLKAEDYLGEGEN